MKHNRQLPKRKQRASYRSVFLCRPPIRRKPRFAEYCNRQRNTRCRDTRSIPSWSQCCNMRFPKRRHSAEYRRKCLYNCLLPSCRHRQYPSQLRFCNRKSLCRSCSRKRINRTVLPDCQPLRFLFPLKGQERAASAHRCLPERHCPERLQRWRSEMQARLPARSEKISGASYS